MAQIARFMRLAWGPPGAIRTQVGTMLALWTLLSGGILHQQIWNLAYHVVEIRLLIVIWSKLDRSAISVDNPVVFFILIEHVVLVEIISLLSPFSSNRQSFKDRLKLSLSTCFIPSITTLVVKLYQNAHNHNFKSILAGISPVEPRRCLHSSSNGILVTY